MRVEKKKAVVLLSGGLDSATTLYYAKDKGYATQCLIFDYGQRHRKEIDLAKKIARKSGSPFCVVPVSLPWKGSALLDRKQKIPENKVIREDRIPSTYVPGRNIIFLSFAASFAESIGAEDIFIGANAVDYSGYPDCRPVFLKSFQKALQEGTKAGVQSRGFKVRAPLVRKTKAQIISLGQKLGVPYQLTWSCYKGLKKPCGVCDSCRIRKKGFESVGIIDPAINNKWKD